MTHMRHLFQKTMEADFVEAVERLTGRHVTAFISGNNVTPDIGRRALHPRHAAHADRATNLSHPQLTLSKLIATVSKQWLRVRDSYGARMRAALWEVVP